MTPYERSDRLWRFAARVGKVVDGLPEECDQLCRILGKSVSTAKGNRKQSAPPNNQ